jgi:hypothetical protein
MKMIIYLLFLFSLFFIFPPEAKAYLNPGSGSYIVQILVAALAGGGFLITAKWEKIKSLFCKREKNDEKKKDK